MCACVVVVRWMFECVVCVRCVVGVRVCGKLGVAPHTCVHGRCERDV